MFFNVKLSIFYEKNNRFVYVRNDGSKNQP